MTITLIVIVIIHTDQMKIIKLTLLHLFTQTELFTGQGKLFILNRLY